VIVAAHQPSYLPWLGYLDKLARADLFVVMDDLQFEAANFQNRNRVKTNRGAQWLTVPVERGAQTDRIVDKRIDDTGLGGRHHWQRRAWRTLEIHYGAAPAFAAHARAFEAIYTRRWRWLVDLDLHVLELARAWYGITTPVVRSSTLGLRGARSERLVDLCGRVGADTYLSGRGGSTSYLDLAAFERAGIAVVWQQFAHPVYPQRYPALGFVSNLAFVDHLCNTGAARADQAAA
jgi:hypothetical protein